MGARIRDADGDIWEQESDGEWSCRQPDHTYVSSLPTREAVELIFGPISEVDP